MISKIEYSRSGHCLLIILSEPLIDRSEAEHKEQEGCHMMGPFPRNLPKVHSSEEMEKVQHQNCTTFYHLVIES